MFDIKERFKILGIETAEEYIEKKRKSSLEKKAKELARRTLIEEEGVCESCGSPDKIMWVHDDEFYLCYGCFIYDLQCSADAYGPYHSSKYIEEYMSENEWDDHFEEEYEDV